MIERVSILGGTGDEGLGLALRWAKAGYSIVIGSRQQERADAAAGEVAERVGGADVGGMENAGAAAASDVVVVTVPYAGQAAMYKSVAEHVRPGAVVVDCTVPVAASVGGKPTHILGVWQGSAAQQAQALLPKGTVVVGAFHSLAAAALGDLEREMEGDVLVCGTRKEGRERVRELVEAIPNLRWIDAGPLENARIIEPITALLIGINHRYKTHGAGIKVTGLPRAT
jgi:8-hydroxy-5-deazaflavin:NADPH oxidoreductase